MRYFKFLILNLAVIFFFASCATKAKEVKKEEVPPAPPVEVAQELPPPPPEIKPEVRPVPPPTPASQPAPAPEKKESFILLNFDDADLKDIISLVTEATGENFIIAPGVTARITINSSKKIPASELFPIFESILEMNGLAAVKSGLFYKIVPGAAARQKAIEIQKGRDLSAIPAEDRLITQIVPVESIPVSEAVTVLQPMVSPLGVIVPNTRNNLLIITDVASNIRRLVEILKEIDVSAFENTRVRLIAPKNVDVKTLAKELADILNALALGREGINLIPLERLNKLLVFSPSEKSLKNIEDWARKLDEEIAPSGLTTFVYPVQNVKAKEIAEVLKTIYESKEGAKPVTTTPAPTPRPAPTRPARPGARATTTPAPVPTPITIAEGRAGGEIKIVVYEPTNSLVILASPGDYKQIVDTIKKLDIFPQQVLIEVLIAEVSLDESTRLGLQWSLFNQDTAYFRGEKHTFEGLSQMRSSTFPAPTTATNIGSSPLITAFPSTTAAGYSYLLYEAGRLTAMLHALAAEGMVNVLSSPHLLVRDNQEANINVGSEVPTSTGVTQQVTGAQTPLSQNIQYKTIGVKLKMKPVINAEKTVVLDISQEVSEQAADVNVGGLTYPSFSKREAKTSIVVSDGQSIIIGGIMREKNTKSYEGIPLLSKIPLLGYLFRYTTDAVSKTELVILLTPHVVSNKTEADRITSDFKERIKELKKPLRQHEEELEKIQREKGKKEEEPKMEELYSPRS